MPTIGRRLAGPAALLLMAATAHAQVLFTEDFGGDAPLGARGWTVAAEGARSTWTVVDGTLRIVCHRSPYQGGRISRDVPAVERGVLELDCLLAEDGLANYDHLSLGIKLFGHMIAFKRYAGHHLMAYRPGENTWYDITGAVPLGEWVHLRMEFDIPAGRVEYYPGDEPDPLVIDTRLPMAIEGEAGPLEIFNYGLTRGTVVHRVDNIILRGLGAEEEAPAERDRALVFEGPTSERYACARIIADALGPERVYVYTMATRGAATTPRNKLMLDRVPGSATWRQARWVVLADVAAGPDDCLPPHLIADIERAVREGASLLVLGGPFALGKGAYAGTPLEELLPVTLVGPWELRRFDDPQPLDAVAGQAAVRWYHEVSPRAESRVPLRAADRPMAVSWQLGEGRVGVFLGTTLGDEADFAGTQPFWDWDGWPSLLLEMAGITEAGGGTQ